MQLLETLFSSLTTKDILTVTLSATAFIFSTVASVFGYLRKRNEDRRHFSNQVHSLVTRLLELGTDYNKDLAKANQDVALAFRTNGEKGNANAMNEFTATSQLRAQHMVALARRAEELIRTTKANITDVEYSAVAKGLAFVQDPIAGKMFDRAVRAAPSAVYKIFNYRDYAVALFLAGSVEEGRNIYQAAINFIGRLEDKLTRANVRRKSRIEGLGTDHLHYQKGVTHQWWSNSEFGMQFVKESQQQIEAAQQAFGQIENEFARNQALNQMRAMSPAVAGSVPIPVAAGLGSSAPETHNA